MNLKDFDYNLPEDLIAQEPTRKREDSRLMVVFRKEGRREHRYFRDLVDYLKGGDALVLNDTRVIPARLKGVRKSGGRTEVLLVRLEKDNLWHCLVRPGKRIKAGDTIDFDGNLRGIVREKRPSGCIIEFIHRGNFKKILKEIGEVPLPPYIRREGSPGEADRIRYQTVYASKDGAIAAPTAGLHFTNKIIRRIEGKGVDVFKITLHIGPGTFIPVRSSDVTMHRMESEYLEIDSDTLCKIRLVLKSSHRLIAVGTSTVRALESVIDTPGFSGGSLWTNLYIYPGYEFKAISGLITNFHLPKSTPLLLTCAFAGRDLVMEAYREAIERKYRFLSYGDAMLILP